MLNELGEDSGRPGQIQPPAACLHSDMRTSGFILYIQSMRIIIGISFIRLC